jgi:hypothetical protein
VGYAHGSTLVEQWNGTEWARVASPTPPDATDVALEDVSCVSTTNCVAVGRASNATLVERWNGSTWTITLSPNPAGASYSAFNGVSCASATSCFAVGRSAVSPGSLIERWNGTTWSIMASSSQGGQLLDVSCSSTTSCLAVGTDFGGTNHGIVEQWDGSDWSAVPAQQHGTIDGFSGVSCTSSTNCFVLGATVEGIFTLTTHAFIDHWDGANWSDSPVSSGPPSNAVSTFLASVSCVRATSCSTVGEYKNNFGIYTLVERYS